MSKTAQLHTLPSGVALLDEAVAWALRSRREYRQRRHWRLTPAVFLVPVRRDGQNITLG
jgi:hypothetical protein